MINIEAIWLTLLELQENIWKAEKLRSKNLPEGCENREGEF